MDLSRFLFKNTGDGAPNEVGKLGNQTDDAGDLWCAVAHTKWGAIPGKAKDNTCWYSYAGEEHETSDFSWLGGDVELETVQHQAYTPYGALPVGFEYDAMHARMFTAVAITEWGEVPGRAKDGICYYPYAGEEHMTSEFYWVVTKDSNRA